MHCKSCGATFADGLMKCPVCGEEVLFTQGAGAGAPAGESPDTPQAQETRRHRQSIAPIKSIYKLRLCLLFVAALALAAGIIEVAVASRYLEDTMAETTFEDLTMFVTWGLIAINVVEYLLLAKVIRDIHTLAEILPSFRKAVYYGIASITLVGVGIFVSSPVITIAAAVIDILLVKSYCASMSELCLPRYHKANDQWKLYWKIFWVLTLVSIGFGVYVAFKLDQVSNDMTFSYWKHAFGSSYDRYITYAGERIHWMYLSLAFTALATIVTTLLELRALRTTQKVFEEEK